MGRFGAMPAKFHEIGFTETPGYCKIRTKDGGGTGMPAGRIEQQRMGCV